MHSPTLSGASGRLHMADAKDIRAGAVVKMADDSRRALIGRFIQAAQP